jgi:hypothetical protein
MPLIGDTIRLKGEFKGFDGEYVDPDDVKLVVYDGQQKEVAEVTPTHDDTGKYYHDYVIPEGRTSTMYFEYIGTLGGMPILGRKSFERKWA